MAAWAGSPVADRGDRAVASASRLAAARLALAGAFTALLVACRLMDVVFAVAIVVWLAWTDRRGLRWFLPVPILAGVALLSLQPLVLRHDPGWAGQARATITRNYTACRAHGQATSSTGCSEP